MSASVAYVNKGAEPDLDGDLQADEQVRPDEVQDVRPDDVHVKIPEKDDDPPLPPDEGRKAFLYCILVFVVLLVIAVVVLALAVYTKGFGRWQDTEQKPEQEHARSTVCETPDCVAASAMIAYNMEPKANPCEDFYTYACGGYDRKNVLDASESNRNSFSTLGSELTIRMKTLLETPHELDNLNAVKQAKTLYRSCMDEASIDALGTAPVVKFINDRGGWPFLDTNWNDANFNFEEYHSQDYNTAIILYIPRVDTENSVRIMSILQGNLIIPNQLFYEDDTQVALLTDTLTKLAIAFGVDAATASMEMTKITQFEKQLAAIQVPPGDRRHPSNTVTMTMEQAQTSIADIDVLKLINSVLKNLKVDVTLTKSDNVSLTDIEYLKELGTLLKQTETRTIATYIQMKALVDGLQYMDTPTRAIFDNLMKKLIGAPLGKSRYSTCTDRVNTNLPFVLARMYVHNYVKEGSEEIEELMDDIKEVFKARLHDQDWLDTASRQYALQKVLNMKLKLGYPKWILDNDKLEKRVTVTDLDDKTYLANVLKMVDESLARMYSDLGQVVDRFAWNQYRPPLTVNAFYNTEENAMIFPIGIFQPPFYYAKGAKAVNYGAIGKIIGHEITHGFDSNGRFYDKDGNKNEWMTAPSINNFNTKAKCLEDQYSEITIEQLGTKVNGKLTLSENIADTGGIRQGFQAYQNWVQKHGEELPLPGLNVTTEQLYFIGFGQLYCWITTPEYLKLRAQIDVHTPNRERIIGILRNSNDFARAFNCPSGSKMNPVQKCSIW